jgi:hypothetical protein
VPLGRDLGVAMIAAAAICTATSASNGASSEGSPGEPEPGLRVRLIVADDLPARARTTLVKEAATIWLREGVHLEWCSPVEEQPRAGVALRVLVGRLLGAGGQGEAWPVGELLPGQSGDRIAIASITAAQRVLDSSGRGAEPAGLGEHRLGLVLGRAVAHEIGHYLLGRTHTRRGLMRAQIDASDFADLRDGGFFLDGVASGRLHEVLAHGMLSGKSVVPTLVSR